jgi:hypothetical protein
MCLTLFHKQSNKINFINYAKKAFAPVTTISAKVNKMNECFIPALNSPSEIFPITISAKKRLN